MPRYPDEDLKYTRYDLMAALAAILGSTPEDARIIEAYEQMVSEWVLNADDQDTAYAAYFQSGAIANETDMTVARTWASGRMLMD
jgi:hypothetical protein